MAVLLWVFGALLSFCLMAVGGRELSGAINTFEILFMRSAIGLAAIALIIFKTGDRSLLTTKRFKLHLGRNVTHFAGQYGWFVGLGFLPLATVSALEFTTPLWTLIVAAIFLGETFTAKKVIAIILGLFGVYLILNPNGEIFNPYAFYVLGAALFYGVSYTFTKALTPTDKPLTILFFMCAMQLPLGLAIGASHFVWPDAHQWFWLVAVGLSALSAHYCMANAMRHAEVSVVVTLDFFRLPLISSVGMLAYQEPFKPMLLVAAVLMMLGNLINLRKPASNSQEPPPTKPIQ
jgi:drug/metabolite transporter (DMT)-like permease